MANTQQITNPNQINPPPTGTGGGIISSDGWNSDPNIWTFQYQDAPIYYVGVNANVTGTIGVGMKIQLTNLSQIKNFFVNDLLYSGTSTYLALYGGTDYQISGSITNPKYSQANSPFGFPLDEGKWTVSVSDTGNANKSSPVISTWYGGVNLSPTGPSIIAPIGAWRGYYKGIAYVNDVTTTAYNCYITLSNANNSESDPDNTSFIAFQVPSGTYAFFNVASVIVRINIKSKTTYYLNVMTTNAASAIAIRGDVRPTIIKLVCAYL